MSLLLLIDGYNVIAPVAPPSRSRLSPDPDVRWLQQERMQLVQRLVEHLDPEVRGRTCVIFDAANPPADRSSQFQVEGIEIRFAVDYLEADDLLEEIIAANSAPKSLAVVSSDHRVQAAAKRRGARTFESQDWLDDLLDGRVRLAVPRDARAGQGSEQVGDEKPTHQVNEDDVKKWMREFGF